MQEMLAGLVDELRTVGIGVCIGEHLDAARALSQISLRDKEVVRAALQCALVKGAELIAAMTDQELKDTLRSVIGSQDAHILRLLADEYVRRFGGLEPGSAVAGVFAAIAVDEAADLGGLRAELLGDQAETSGDGGGGGGSGGGGGTGSTTSGSGGGLRA